MPHLSRSTNTIRIIITAPPLIFPCSLISYSRNKVPRTTVNPNHYPTRPEKAEPAVLCSLKRQVDQLSNCSQVLAAEILFPESLVQPGVDLGGVSHA